MPKVSVKDKIYECEVKRPYIVNGERVYLWRTKNVRDALLDGDREFRCKDCHGAVKLFRKHVEHAAAPHAEHIEKQDSEYCVAGMYFKEAKDGRKPRLSLMPVD